MRLLNIIFFIFFSSCRLLDHNYIIPTTIADKNISQNSNNKISIQYNNQPISLTSYSIQMYPNNPGEQDLHFLTKMTESYYLVSDEISQIIKNSTIHALPYDSLAGLEILRLMLLSQQNPIGFEWEKNVLTKDFAKKKKYASLLGVYEILKHLYQFEDVMNFIRLYNEFSQLYDFHIENESPFVSGLLLQIPHIQKYIHQNQCSQVIETVSLFEKVYHEQDTTAFENIRLSRSYLFLFSKMNREQQNQVLIDAAVFQNLNPDNLETMKIQWWWDGFAEAFSLGAYCYIQKNDYAKGLKLLLLSLSLSPHHPDNLFSAAQLYFLEGSYKNAGSLFTMVIQFGSKEQKISAYKNLIGMAKEQNNSEELQKYEKALLLLESKK